MHREKWRYTRRSEETVILWDLFDKVVNWIDIFKQIGDVAVQNDPVHAALPLAGVRFILQVAANKLQKRIITKRYPGRCKWPSSICLCYWGCRFNSWNHLSLWLRNWKHYGQLWTGMPYRTSSGHTFGHFLSIFTSNSNSSPTPLRHSRIVHRSPSPYFDIWQKW